MTDFEVALRRWDTTQAYLSDDLVELHEEMQSLLQTGFPASAILTSIPSCELTEWLSPIELLSGDNAELDERQDASERAYRVGFSYGYNEENYSYEACMSIVGATANDDRVEVIYLLHINEDKKVLDTTSIWYEFNNKLRGRTSSTDSGPHMLVGGREHLEWGFLAMTLMLESGERSPIVYADLETVHTLFGAVGALANK